MSLLCLLPPHILKKILENGSPAQVRRARRLMAAAERLRAKRSTRRTGPPSPPRTPRRKPRSRVVFDAQHRESLPGLMRRSEGSSPLRDRAVNEAYDGSGALSDFLWEAFQRDSLDGLGLSLVSTVHYGKDFPNAFWDGRQMIYGDGDGKIFDVFTRDLDVIGHELGHGLIQHSANLVYSRQAGALNESFADVFGSLLKQWKAGEEARKADWLMGEHVLIGRKYALRSLKAPGTGYINHPLLGDDPQPATMAGYQALPMNEDRGGVHINSGIPNHAFYRTAFELKGRAWEKAGLIWFRALKNRLKSTSDFPAAALATCREAASLYGPRSLPLKAVESAWKAVGLG